MLGQARFIEQGLISGEDAEDRLHRQTIFIEWDTDGEEQNPVYMPALYRGNDEDLDEYNDRLCDWLSDSTGWCVMDWQFIPQAIEGNDGEYYLQNIKEDELQGYMYPNTTVAEKDKDGMYREQADNGVLLIAKGYAFGNGSKALQVWQEDGVGRKYICLDDSIVYLDDIGQEVKIHNAFKEVIQ